MKRKRAKAPVVGGVKIFAPGLVYGTECGDYVCVGIRANEGGQKIAMMLAVDEAKDELRDNGEISPDCFIAAECPVFVVDGTERTSPDRIRAEDLEKCEDETEEDFEARIKEEELPLNAAKPKRTFALFTDGLGEIGREAKKHHEKMAKAKAELRRTKRKLRIRRAWSLLQLAIAAYFAWKVVAWLNS